MGAINMTTLGKVKSEEGRACWQLLLTLLQQSNPPQSPSCSQMTSRPLLPTLWKRQVWSVFSHL